MRQHLRLMLLIWPLVLTACAGPASSPLDGRVTLTGPPDGAVIYASALRVSGTLADVDEKVLLVRLSDPDATVISEASVNAEAGDWAIELVHDYSGEPVEVLVEVLPADAPDAGVMAAASILMAGLEHRPDGAFGDVIFPNQGTAVGGDQIVVTGRASGLPDQTFTVELVASDGTVLDSQTVTLAGPFALDDLPWQVDLSLTDYTGNAVVTVRFSDELTETIAVLVTDAAG